MENEKILNENIPVSDEEIEEVAGGVPIYGKKACARCGKSVFTTNLVVVNGKAICQDCKAKLENK